LISRVDIPHAADARRSFYLKVRERESYEFATVSVAALVQVGGDRITAARIALGGVAHKPWRLTAAERALAGAPIGAREIDAALQPDFADARPLPRNAYKIDLARRATVHAVLRAGEAQ
jgi:xanthine dehydrogenase YagS FAD-binding subunit